MSGDHITAQKSCREWGGSDDKRRRSAGKIVRTVCLSARREEEMSMEKQLTMKAE